MIETFTREKKVKGRKKLHCADCKRETFHTIEARCSSRWSDHHGNAGGGSTYSILRCGACDAVCYETVSWDDNDVDIDSDGHQYNPVYPIQYPAPVSAQFDFNLQSTPPKLNAILDEMLYAMAGNKLTLATIGLRLAVEFIVKDNKCGGRNLAQRIDDLRARDLIDDDQQNILHKIRLRGNDGAHEAKGMKPTELIAGMSIIEGLLEKLYTGPARHADTIKRAKQMFPDEIDFEKMLG